MRIIIVPSSYPSKKNKVAGIFFKEQAKMLIRSGVDVTVLYPEIISLKEFKFGLNKIIYENDEGIPTYRIQVFNYLPMTSAGSGIIFRKTLIKLYNEYRKKFHKPDLIHAHSVIWGGYAANHISRKEKIPLIITEHASYIAKGRIPNQQWKIVQKVLNHTEDLIAVSSSLGNDLGRYGCGDINVIPNMVDTKFFDFKEKRKLDKSKPFSFFSLAILTNNKRIDLIISAFAKKFKGKNVELVIGGDGPERRNLEILVNNLEIEKQVKFLGKLSREEVREELHKSNCFVLTSEYETFGVVYIEALSTGTPIIATKCGGPEDIVINDVGILIEPGNEEELANSMEKIMKKYNTLNFNFIRNYCLEHFGHEKVSERLLNQYKIVLSKQQKLKN